LRWFLVRTSILILLKKSCLVCFQVSMFCSENCSSPIWCWSFINQCNKKNQFWITVASETLVIHLYSVRRLSLWRLWPNDERWNIFHRFITFSDCKVGIFTAYVKEAFSMTSLSWLGHQKLTPLSSAISEKIHILVEVRRQENQCAAFKRCQRRLVHLFWGRVAQLLELTLFVNFLGNYFSLKAQHQSREIYARALNSFEVKKLNWSCRF
jgi:hypothetical protein